MDSFLVVICAILIIFGMGYDFSSYMMMRRVDSQYKKHNKYFLGYNTYMVWKTARTVMKD